MRCVCVKILTCTTYAQLNGCTAYIHTELRLTACLNTEYISAGRKMQGCITSHHMAACSACQRMPWFCGGLGIRNMASNAVHAHTSVHQTPVHHNGSRQKDYTIGAPRSA